MRFQVFILLLAFAGFAFVFSCKTKKSAVSAEAEKLVSLQTTGCYGHCPVYTLTVYTSGKVVFEPQMFTVQTDTMVKQITAEELTALQRQVKAVNLSQYPDRIESMVMDAAMGILKTYNPEKSVTGSIDRPEPLLNLEATLKELGLAHGIETKKGRNPKDPAPESAAQLIVRLKESVNAGNWIAKWGDLKLRLVKRMPTGNTWLLEYDKSQVTEAQILDVIRTDASVEAAQANHRSQERE